MHFEYEITADDYVGSQLLYYRLSLGSKLAKRIATWVLAGLFFLAVGWTERSSEWELILLTVVGGWCIYCGFRSAFPASYFRRAYEGADLAGKRFKADIDKDGFEVEGDLCAWRVRWPGVKLKGENERVFILFAANTIFMFGKNYLDEGQQQELRRLSGLQGHS